MDGSSVLEICVEDESHSHFEVTTAAAVCAVLDLLVAGKLPDRGFVRQEDVKLDDFLTNRFGRYFTSENGPADAGVSDRREGI